MPQTLAYIELANSNASLRKKFRMLAESLEPMSNAARTLQRGLTGTLDVQEGARWRSWMGVLKVYHTDPLAASSYGSRADLTTLFNLSNPTATPSDVISLYDSIDTNDDGVGDLVTVIFGMPSLVFKNGSAMLTGTNAFFYVPIVLEEKI